jgi:hypothetical protein
MSMIFLNVTDIRYKSLWKHVEIYFLSIERRVNLNYFLSEGVMSGE